MIRSGIILIIALAALVAAADILFLRTIYLGSAKPLSERVALLKPEIEAFRPEGDGPFSTVLLFHGCGGLVGERGEKDIMRGYANVAVEAGYAAFIVDSLTPRKIDFKSAVDRVCAGLKLRGRERAGDVLAAISIASSEPFVDASHIVLAGWSHGGWTVMDTMTMDMKTSWPAAMKRPEADPLVAVKGVYLTYPFCGFPALSHRLSWVRKPPTSVIVAEYDEVVQMGRCAQTLIKMDADGVPLEVEIFNNVTHAFDERDQTAESAFTFDAEASAQALQRFKSYLVDLKDGAPFPNPERVMVDAEEIKRR